MNQILQAELAIESSVYHAGSWSDLTAEVLNFMKSREKIRGYCTVEWVVKSSHPVEFITLSRRLGEMTDCLVEAPSQVKEFTVRIEKSSLDHDIICILIKEID
jgi:hypothetical protein